MKRIKKFSASFMTCIFATSVFFSFPSISLAEEPMSNKLCNAKYCSDEITIDGNLTEGIWANLSQQLNNNLTETVSNNEASFSTAWNDSNLYIAIQVKDENLVNKSHPNEQLYEDDSVEIFIDGDNSKLVNQYDENDNQICIRYDGTVYTTRKGSSTDLKDKIQTAVQSIADGYTVEVAIPWAELGQTPSDGKAIGLDIANNDNDSDVRSSVLTWNATRNEAWKNPSVFGTALLYKKNTPVISNAGTPIMDGVKDTAWKMDQTLSVGDHTISFGSMCDKDNLYVGVLRERKDNTESITKENVAIYFDGDRDKSGKLNTYDNGITFESSTKSFNVYPTYSWTGTQYLYSETSNGYFLELKIPLKNLLPRIKNGAIIGFDVTAQYDNATNHYWKAWNGIGDNWKDNSQYGTLILNNPSIISNRAPSLPKQMTYAIEHNKSVDGQVTATDLDGDSITYSIPTEKAPSNGTASVDPNNGKWSYTPKSDFIGKENFWIQASDGKGGSSSTRIQVEVNYPASQRILYVDGVNGNDDNKGLTKENAFRNIQKAHDISLPGDTIYIMNGTYGQTSNQGSLTVTRSGLPNAYITYKAYPGHHPVLNSGDAWNTLLVESASYIKIEGLTLEGNADSITEEQAREVYDRFMDGNITWGKETSVTNTNGLSIRPKSRLSGGKVTLDTVDIPHHIEVRNCNVNNMAAGGICVEEADYITIENNDVSENCHWDIFGCSGISVFHSLDIDNNTEQYKNIVRGNKSYQNYHLIPWYTKGELSDGNGIIIDDNKNTQIGSLPYQGKTLVVNNLVYENGGTGMHAFSSSNVDIINNTAWNNNATPELKWGEITAGDCDNVNLINNVSYARKGNPVNHNNNNKNVIYDYNIYFNGIVNAKGSHDLELDPLFTNIDNRDFTLKSNSPGIGSGNSTWSKAVENSNNLRGYFQTVGVNRHDSTCDIEGHKWDSGTIIKEATSNEQGTILYTCTECGAEKENAFDYEPEKTDDGKTPDDNDTPDNSNSSNDKDSSNKTDVPKTSDDAYIGLFFTLIFVSGLSFSYIWWKKSKNIDNLKL